MNKLYVNPSGQEVTKHSYSSGETFESCPRLYEYEKVRGIRRKDKSAAMAFGRCVESSLQFYHTNNRAPGSGVDEFKRLWLGYKDNAELDYKATERDWANLYRAGSEMLRLYEIRLPDLPIVDPAWQLNYAKEVFPGTELAGLSDQGYVDILSRAPWDHPLLPKVTAPPNSPYRPLVIDVKTAGKPLDVDPRYLALDAQLMHYAWLTGYPDTAFLWFTKSVADAYESGTRVTLLEKSGKWTEGADLVVFRYDPETELAVVGDAGRVRELKEAINEIKGRGSTEAKTKLVDQFLLDGLTATLDARSLTKQRLQFAAARISPEDIVEAGNRAARQIVDIVDCSRKGVFPKRPSIRFPNRKCPMCSHRGICLGDPVLTEELLVQITPAAKEEDWLAELEDSE